MGLIFNSGSEYGPVSKFFHWVIAVLVLFMLLLGYFMDDISEKVLRGSVVNMHKLIGISILALMLLRLCWALINPKPSLANTKPWERWTERFVHYSLYFSVIAMPLSGWIGSVTGGRPPRINQFVANLPLEKNEAWADFSFFMHNTLAIVIMALVSIHILAGLFHYFFKKDKVLQRMWP